jgi:hypothetical protein
MNLSILVGFILPPFIDLLNNKVTNTVVKFWVSLLVCTVIGVVLNLDKLKDPTQLLGTLGIIFAEAQTVYHTYWQQSKARQELTKII